MSSNTPLTRPEGNVISSLADSAIEKMLDQDIDYVIRSVTVIDGNGGGGYVADVAISGTKIARVGEVGPCGCTEIDAKGLCLSPGFIDVHTHDDIQVLKDPEMLAKVSQGVTSVVVGNCGISASPVTLEAVPPDPMNILGDRFDFAFDSVRKYAEAVYQANPATNVAALVGHTSLRVATMDSLDRAATDEEITRMCEILDNALQQGAIGLSTGLAYATAKQSSTDEVMRLAKIVHRHEGIYTTHLRDEHDRIIEAMDEAFLIGRESYISVVISHFKCAGMRNWGRTAETISHLSAASKQQEVACDCYPYAASSSTLDVDQVTDDFDISITWSDPHPEEARQTIEAIAKKWNVSKIEAAKRLQPASAVYHNMCEEDVERVLAYHDCMIGSDGLPNDKHPHPRLWGTFPRVLGHYSRERSLFSLEEAIRKMTSLPAKKFKLTGRGVVAEGNYADLVLFDPNTIKDSATYEEPLKPAIGVQAVWVNGEMTYEPDNGVINRNGRMLTSNPLHDLIIQSAG